MFRTHALAGFSVLALCAGALIAASPAAALQPSDAPALPPGKATGSGQYGLIGGTQRPIENIYGVTIDAEGSIWYAASGGPDKGITQYRSGTFDPAGGDYLGNGEYADGQGYLRSAWESPVRYVNRDSTASEPRGIEPLPGGGIAVNDTNGDTNTPEGTILLYDEGHTAIIGNASFARNEGCQQLAQGEVAWGPYFTVLDGLLYAPYEGCNVVSVFDVPEGNPLFRLTGVGQTAGIQPNPPSVAGIGGLADIYSVSTDGTALFTTDLGVNRAQNAGLVQRWIIDPANESWVPDTEFAGGEGIALPGRQIYNTVPDRDALYVIPGTGQVQRYAINGTGEATMVNVPGMPYLIARDLAVTSEGWLAMTVRANNSLRLVAESPSPVTGLSGATGVTAGSATLEWTSVETEYGQAPVLDYVIEHSADGGDSWEVVDRDPSLDPTATITGLAAGEHDFRVTAHSEAGRGDAATVAAVVVADPDPAIGVSLEGTPLDPTAEGDPIEWVATVSNPGNTPLTEVSATFERGAENEPETVAVADLAVAGSAGATVSSPVTAQQLVDLAARNAVTVTGTDPEGAVVTEQATATVTLTKKGGTVPPVDPPVDPPVTPPVDPPVDPPVAPPVDPESPPTAPPKSAADLAATGGSPLTLGLLAAGALLLVGAASALTGRFRSRESGAAD